MSNLHVLFVCGCCANPDMLFTDKHGKVVQDSLLVFYTSVYSMHNIVSAISKCL